MAALMLEGIMDQKMGLDPAKGIDMHFLTQANTSKKPIVELESVDFQINLLFSVDDKICDKWLAGLFKENTKDELDKMIKAWKEGNEKFFDDMNKESETDPDGAKMMDLMLYQRNVGMAKKADEMLKGKDKIFVVVGADHLIGDKGVIKLLEAKGYKVDRPVLTNPPKP